MAKAKTDDNADFLRIARERMDEAETADEENRERAENDLTFLTGDQWPEEIRRAREAEEKPCLTINGLPQFVRQVTGQIRQLNPAIRVVAVDNDATDDVAEVIAGLIKQVENQADAPSIYERAAETAAACGIGHWRVRSDYVEGETFDQELIIEPIHNPFSVFWDPLAKHPTRKDAGWCFITEEMRLEDFKKAYPDADTSSVTSENRPDSVHRWFTTETVTCAEYFYTEFDEYKIGLMPDGQIVRDPVAPMNVTKTRTIKEPRIMWAKITGQEILEGPTRIPSRWIPVFSVTGEEWHLGEEMYRSSVIRFAKDPQQLYNYSRSAHAETVALQPKAPFLVTAHEVAGFEGFWNQANSSNRPYLPFNPDPAMGSRRPQRSSPPVPSTGLLQEISLAGEDMKRTTGIYDASLGAKSNETSGVAIQQRQMESQLGSSIYADNMVKAILQCGKVMVSMIPSIYDTQRVVRILGDDDQEKAEIINAVMMTQDGPVSINDMTLGKYDVRISVGPSYDTKRAEARDGMMEFLRVYPPAAQVTADLVAKSQDWPDADKFSDRLRKTLPAGVLDPDDMDDDERQQYEAAQQQMQQQQQQAVQMEQAKLQLDLMETQAKARKTVAEIGETEADTRKTAMETADLQLELAAKSGQLSAIIQQAVRQAVVGVLAAQQQDAQAQPFSNGRGPF